MAGRSAVVRVPLWLLIVVTAVVLMRLVPLPFKRIFVVGFTAILIASAVAPAATKLERYRVPRGISIIFAYLVVVGVLVGLVALVVPLVLGEIRTLQARIPGYQADVNGLILRFTPPDKTPLTANDIFSKLSDNLSTIARQLTDLLFRIAGVLVQLLIVLVAAYFLAVDPQFAERVVTRFSPPQHRDRTLLVLRHMGSRLGHWVRAQLVLAIFFGAMFGIGLGILGVPYALTLGILGGVLELIPYIGGFVTLVLAILVAATNDPFQVIGVTIIYTIVTNVEAHVLAPNVMGRILGLHPLTVVFALFVGTETLGILGALLSVPLAVVLQVVLDELYVTGPQSQPATPRTIESHSVTAAEGGSESAR